MARALHDWLGSYLEYSQHSEAPDHFHFWTGVSCLAGAMRRQCWIDMGYFQWVPNFYIILVAPPGIVSKSTTVDIGMRLLRQVPGIKFGPDSINWQTLVMDLAECGEVFLIDDLQYTMSALTISAKELGVFFNPNDRELVNALVSLWDGQQDIFKKATKTQGRDDITNPWINIIGCTTPSWISDSVPEYMIGGGFVSRTIFIYGEEKRKMSAYPIDNFSDQDNNLKQQLIEDLIHITTQIIGPFTFTKDAHDWGVQWYHDFYSNYREKLVTGRYANSIARKQTHIHKLAMVLSASHRDDRVIDIGDLQSAESHVSEAEEYLPKVFRHIHAPEAKAANELVALLQRRKTIPKTAAYRLLFHTMSLDQFNNAVDAGVASGQFAVEPTDQGMNLVMKEYYNGSE